MTFSVVNSSGCKQDIPFESELVIKFSQLEDIALNRLHFYDNRLVWCLLHFIAIGFNDIKRFRGDGNLIKVGPHIAI